MGNLTSEWNFTLLLLVSLHSLSIIACVSMTIFVSVTTFVAVGTGTCPKVNFIYVLGGIGSGGFCNGGSSSSGIVRGAFSGIVGGFSKFTESIGMQEGGGFNGGIEKLSFSSTKRFFDRRGGIGRSG